MVEPSKLAIRYPFKKHKAYSKRNMANNQITTQNPFQLRHGTTEDSVPVRRNLAPLNKRDNSA